MLEDLSPSSLGVTRRHKLGASKTLEPPQFFHRPRGVPYLDHALDLIIRTHRYHIHIVRMGLFVRRGYRATVSRVFGVIGGKEDRRSRGLVIARRVEVVRGTRRGDTSESRHPLTIGFHGLDGSKRFTLGNKRGALLDIGLAARPTCWGLTGVEEFFRILKSCHDCSFSGCGGDVFSDAERSR